MDTDVVAAFRDVWSNATASFSNMKLLIVSVLVAITSGLPTENEEKVAGQDPQHWYRLAKEDIAKAERLARNTNLAKNVIFFVGDGMGVSTVAAARIYKGQKEGKPGEEGYLSFEKFPHLSLVKTYNVDKQVPDSAATATAYLCGVKGNYYTLGVNAQAKFNVCDTELRTETWADSVLQWAQESGRDTGFLTTTRITHATPAAIYAHSNNREWEADGNLPEEARETGSCKDIARQMVENSPGKNTKIILGGGRQQFQNIGNTTKRLDGRNLIQEWRDEKNKRGATHRFVENRDELLSMDLMDNEFVLGLFSPSHIPYELDRNESTEAPTLLEMTRTAVKFLQKNKDNGFFLVVEAGRIDHAHHDNNAARALEETVALHKTVEEVMKMVNLDETLIIVTADHSHSFTVNGYPERGNNILGKVEGESLDYGTDLPYTTLMYATGPGFNKHINSSSTDPFRPFINLTNVDTTDKNFVQLSQVQQPWSSHGGEDVPVYAIGPMSHMFHGVHEQTYVAHIMGYAACMGPYAEDCPHGSNLLPNTLEKLSVAKSATGPSLYFSGLLGIFLAILSFL